MMNTLLKQYLLIYASSMFKFILGPVTGVPMGLSAVEIIFFTVAGMMTTVFVLTFLGTNFRNNFIKRFSNRKRLFTPRNRRIIRIWRKYGIVGVSFLTPLLFSPPVGTIIAVSFGEKRIRIILAMLVSGVFWAVFFTLTGEQLFDLLRKIGLL